MQQKTCNGCARSEGATRRSRGGANDKTLDAAQCDWSQRGGGRRARRSRVVARQLGRTTPSTRGRLRRNPRAQAREFEAATNLVREADCDGVLLASRAADPGSVVEGTPLSPYYGSVAQPFEAGELLDEPAVVAIRRIALVQTERVRAAWLSLAVADPKDRDP